MSTHMSIEQTLRERILILDGAIGTKLQALGVTTEHFHRGRFASWPVSLVGNNDVLCLTAPEVVSHVHRLYIEAGADIITTNTFSSNSISQREYACADEARLMAREGARLARQQADAVSNRKVWVAGSIGPTAKSLTMASDISRAGERQVGFDEMAAAYGEQAEALIEGGADVLLLETCYDALNAKAAIYAIECLNERTGREIPLMVSATVNDRSGRTLTGQTLFAFFRSIAHYPHLLSFGLNCSFGVADLRPFLEQLSPAVPVNLSIYPNAGLPNEMGEYEELPDYTASHLRQMAEAGLLNIAGGCCGTDERHIRRIAEAVRGLQPRALPQADNRLWLSGLEPLLIDRNTQNFTNIGERTNVAGSRRFARLIAAGQHDEALAVARQQIEGGASVIDINMDDAMLDSPSAMQTFCRFIATDPAVARAALMIDSSDWGTVLAGLKNAQGKCIVNSISLKNGEADFLNKARELRRQGAAVVVMAFDEDGQATTFERKTAIAERAYRLLTGIGFPPQEIIIDVNILSVGTGLAEHQAYGIDFIRAVGWIKEHLPQAKTSGGVSNLSFSFRGNNEVREAMHSVFLYHAIKAGLDMAIVNPAMLKAYDEIEPDLLKAVEDVVLNSDDGATERLIAIAQKIKEEKDNDGGKQQPDLAARAHDTWNQRPVEERLAFALANGDSSHLATDIPEALAQYGRPIAVIEQPLMQAMEQIGARFAEGKMFLPQVVKAAQVMKNAVALLQPFIDADAESSASARPKVVLATANGDVHDIGKNIVAIVLACNGFDIVDLGVMVAAETIIEAAKTHTPLFVGVSGLITPSLKEMETLCLMFQREGLRVPVIVGGATTSAIHTAVRLAPLYDGLVAYGGDASQTALIAKRLQMDAEACSGQIRADQHRLCEAYDEHQVKLLPYAEANLQAPHFAVPPAYPTATELQQRVPPLDISLSEVEPFIDWRMFLMFWGFKGETLPQQLVNPEAERTLLEGKSRLREAIALGCLSLQALLRFEPATRSGNDILLPDGERLPMLRSQSSRGHFLCLADYFDEHSSLPLGLFTIVAKTLTEPASEGDRLMSHALCARLAEACAEWLSSQIGLHTLRVAFGYATCPDHSLKRIVVDRLQAEQRLGITVNGHYSIDPSTAICGLYICHPEARYFPVGRIDNEQKADYCRRRGIDELELRD
ncbi:MAG: methionine synthase [Bacteroidaceae bacterium]|nr:methionine synthase [Bacteroidaceae bacterium]